MWVLVSFSGESFRRSRCYIKHPSVFGLRQALAQPAPGCRWAIVDLTATYLRVGQADRQTTGGPVQG
jgi:hypothetical protein